MVQMFRAIGQLKAGVSLESARAELETLHDRLQNTVRRPPCCRPESE